ncbi:MAG TPA: glycogen synthase GlgA [Planctomycetota bacterium]|nr:glycogen synthase GlgA [Planctomycetota bacterium]
MSGKSNRLSAKVNICQVASEMVPFAKTGGLADVLGALTPQLKKSGVNVTAFLPLYKQVKENVSNLVSTGITVKVKVGDNLVAGTIWKTQIQKADVYFIQRDEYYQRDYLYGTSSGDYKDNAERFIFFSRAVLEAIKALGLKCDIIHCHDWQSALIPVYLKTIYKKDPQLAGVKTVLTVHNLAYQGLFWHWDMKLVGLGWEYFNYKQLEFYGQVNFLKGGLVFADMLSTVSPQYAKEIQTPVFGERLDGVLRERAGDLYGIINGVDYDQWNPALDKFIPVKYTGNKIADKEKNKQALQKKCGLPVTAAPMIGMIGRLASQKGFDLVSEVFDEIIKTGCQFVLLGTGEEKYHQLFREIARKYPTQVSANIAFDNSLAHLITAGADMFLMPSRYEPCGLNQLYALKYGTIPIVHETGGLADSINNYTPAGLKAGTASGFSFKNYSAGEMMSCIKSALALYEDKKSWKQLMKNAMQQDFSWEHSGKEYIALYRKLMK